MQWKARLVMAVCGLIVFLFFCAADRAGSRSGSRGGTFRHDAGDGARVDHVDDPAMGPPGTVLDDQERRRLGGARRH